MQLLSFEKQTDFKRIAVTALQLFVLELELLDGLAGGDLDGSLLSHRAYFDLQPVYKQNDLP